MSTISKRNLLLLLTIEFVAVGFAQAQLDPVYRLKYPYGGFYLVDNSTLIATSERSAAPSGSYFRIVKNNIGGKNVMWVTFTKVKSSTAASVTNQITRIANLSSATGGGMTTLPLVQEGADFIYQVSTDVLPPEYFTIESGMDFGTLAVPFKAQLSDGKLTAGGTLGLYVGYLHTLLGLRSTLLISPD